MLIYYNYLFFLDLFLNYVVLIILFLSLYICSKKRINLLMLFLKVILDIVGFLYFSESFL